MRWILFSVALGLMQGSVASKVAAMPATAQPGGYVLAATLQAVWLATLIPMFVSVIYVGADAYNWARRRVAARRPVQMAPVTSEEAAA